MPVAEPECQWQWRHMDMAPGALAHNGAASGTAAACSDVVLVD
jgi:hypothetical protein